MNKKLSVQAQTVIAELVPLLSAGNESPNGPGSSLAAAKDALSHLPKIFKKFKIKSMIDAPCGDWNWTQKLDLKGIKYHGYDIMPEYIEDNKERFGSTNIKFKETDAVEDKVTQKVDLIMCRDFLMHLKWDAIKQLLKNLKSSKSKYFLATNFSNHTAHNDGYLLPVPPDGVGLKIENYNNSMPQWGWRPLNLLLEPFNFPEPIYSFVEKNEHCGGRSMCMWEFKDIDVNIDFGKWPASRKIGHKPLSKWDEWKNSV